MQKAMFQSTEGRDLENGHRICMICLIEQKKNMRITHTCMYIHNEISKHWK